MEFYEWLISYKKNKKKNLNKLARYRKKLEKKPILKDLFLEVTSKCNA